MCCGQDQQQPAWMPRKAGTKPLRDTATDVMETAGSKCCAPATDRDRFVKVVLRCMLDTLSSEDLHQLLTEDAAWKMLVEKTHLTREEASAVREALIELEALSDEDLQMRERFFSAFPYVKKELEEAIAKLYALAEKVDKVHKDCTITNVVARSSGAISGILTILGLTLAPVTAGGSLVLSATGMGLGAAAAVTGVSASIVDLSYKFSAKAKAKHMLSSTEDTAEQVVQGVAQAMPSVVSATTKCVKAFEGIEKVIYAMKVGVSNSQLLANAKPLMNAGKISLQYSRQLPKAFAGTTLAMSNVVRIAGAATAGVFLLMNVYNLVQDSVHLHRGAKTESAAQLRQQAQVLERKLEELIQIHGVCSRA